MRDRRRFKPLPYPIRLTLMPWIWMMNLTLTSNFLNSIFFFVFLFFVVLFVYQLCFFWMWVQFYCFLPFRVDNHLKSLEEITLDGIEVYFIWLYFPLAIVFLLPTYLFVYLLFSSRSYSGWDRNLHFYIFWRCELVLMDLFL